MKVAHTFFFHSGPKAFFKPTVSALVPLVFIHYALSVKPVHTKNTIDLIVGFWKSRKI